MTEAPSSDLAPKAAQAPAWWAHRGERPWHEIIRLERQGLRWLRRQLHQARDTILCRRMRAQPRRLGISPAGQAIREGNGGKAAGAGGKGIDDAAGT